MAAQDNSGQEPKRMRASTKVYSRNLVRFNMVSAYDLISPRGVAIRQQLSKVA